MTMDPIKSLSNEENPFLANLWISNYLRHLIGSRILPLLNQREIISSIKYCIVMWPTRKYIMKKCN